jgi:hypothetical protein
MSSSAHLEVRFPEAQLPGSAYPPSGVSSEDPSSAAAAHAPQAEAAILLASLTKEQRAVLAKLDKVRERERGQVGWRALVLALQGVVTSSALFTSSWPFLRLRSWDYSEPLGPLFELLALPSPASSPYLCPPSCF